MTGKPDVPKTVKQLFNRLKRYMPDMTMEGGDEGQIVIHSGLYAKDGEDDSEIHRGPIEEDEEGEEDESEDDSDENDEGDETEDESEEGCNCQSCRFARGEGPCP